MTQNLICLDMFSVGQLYNILKYSEKDVLNFVRW